MEFTIRNKKFIFSWDLFFVFALAFFIVAGLALKLYLSIYFPLDSDSVGMGLMSMEIGKYHNYMLAGYHLLSSDSLVLTELIPFQLGPQILTNYNPLTLKIVTFGIFLFSILIFGCLVYILTRNTISALLFGALAANIPAEGYYWFAFPTSHNATIAFGGLILLVLLSINTSIKTRKEKNGINRTGIPWFSFILLIVLTFLAVFSDTIILVWVLIPFFSAYILFYKEKTRQMNLTCIFVAIISVLAYGIKTYFIPGWLEAEYGINSISDIFSVNFPLFFKAQAQLLNQGLYQLMNGGNTVTALDILSALIFVVFVLYAARNVIYDIQKNKQEKRFFYAIVLISLVLIFVSFLISVYVYDIHAARYLTFGTFVIFALVAVSYQKKEKIFMVVVLSLLLLSLISGFIFVSTYDVHPNERQYDLITYLADNNLTYGYGTYWDSNIITYLSGGKVTIRSALFSLNGIRPDPLNSCDRWWEYTPEKTFLIYDATRPNDPYQKNIPTKVHQMDPASVLHYQNYDIYPISMTYH
jgi:hypothetical protein